VPELDDGAIIRAGATGFRTIVRTSDIPAVLAAYATSVNRVFYLVAAVASACGVAKRMVNDNPHLMGTTSNLF
jgi:hypothetical protein